MKYGKSYEELKNLFIKYVLLANCDVCYESRESVRQHNSYVDSYRRMARQIGSQYPDCIKDFTHLLDSDSHAIRVCSAVCLVELMPISTNVKDEALSTIKAELNNMDSLKKMGFTMWLEEHCN